MLDTGETYFRFVINRNNVPLGPGTDLFKMHAASGQASTIRTHKGRHKIVLAGTLTTSAESGYGDQADRVVSDDASSTQKNIDPHLLGVLGYTFLKQYDFTIDYRARIVSLYASSTIPNSPTAITIRFAPASPIVPFVLTVGDVRIPAYLDTGGWESLRAPAQIWQRLALGGHLSLGGMNETNCVRILRARYGASEFDVPHAEKITDTKTSLTLGYPFLRRYLSVWRPDDGTVTLIPTPNVPLLPPSSCK